MSKTVEDKRKRLEKVVGWKGKEGVKAAIRYKKETPRDFPGGPVVKTLSFQ